MKIAIIGWGSLIWSSELNNQEFKDKKWNPDGPQLPIEFTRKSNDGRLTLVVTPGAALVQTLWAEFKGTLDEIIGKLQTREKTTHQSIGCIDRRCPRRDAIRKTLATWLEAHKTLDAVVWTDLPPKHFEKKKRGVITEDEAVEYLKALKERDSEAFRRAKEYICNSPVNTPFRKRFLSDVFKCEPSR